MTDHQAVLPKVTVRKMYLTHGGKLVPYKWKAECNQCSWVSLSWAWVRAYEGTEEISGRERVASNGANMMTEGGAYALAFDHQRKHYGAESEYDSIRVL